MVEQSIQTRVMQPDARAPAQARRFVAEVLSQWNLQLLIDTAVLLTSELVTNAIVHAQTEVSVAVRLDEPDCISVSVQDGSSVSPRLAPHADDATTGRGLGILDALATTWTVKAVGSGKVVTFSLRSPSIPQARAPRG